MKEFTLKKVAEYELKVKSRKCINPSELNHLEFIQETKNKYGEVVDTSKYQFFLSNDEVSLLSKNLAEI